MDNKYVTWSYRLTLLAIIAVCVMIGRLVLKLTYVAIVILSFGIAGSWLVGLGMGGLLRQEIDKPRNPTTIEAQR